MKTCINLKSIIASCFAIILIASGCTKADRNDDVVIGDPPPVPGGFTNSSQVAAANLLAYWNFDINRNEAKSGIAPSSSNNVVSARGIKGQGLTFSDGFIAYPALPALAAPDAVGSVTVSMWVNFANNGSKLTNFFALTRETTVENDWLSIINLASETGNHPPTDQNIYLHSWIGSFSTGSRRGGDNINDFGNAGVDYQTVNGANKWVQYLMRYDGATNIIDIYANNIRVSNNNFRVRGGLGPLIFNGPKRVVMGGLPNVSTGYTNSPTLGFHGLLTGSIDEVRVFNKSLTEQEITALYLLERQGR